MESGQIRETQRIPSVNPRRGVAKAPSAGAQTPRTQAISSVCAKRGAAAGDPRRPRPGGAETLRKWKSPPPPWDPGGRVEGAKAPSAGAQTPRTQAISTVCAK